MAGEEGRKRSSLIRISYCVDIAPVGQLEAAASQSQSVPQLLSLMTFDFVSSSNTKTVGHRLTHTPQPMHRFLSTATFNS